MARPTKPKDLKPKVEGEIAEASAAGGGGRGGGLDLKFIIMVVVILIATIGGSVGSAYLMTTMFVVPEIGKIAKAAGAGGEAHAEGGEGAGHDGASTEAAGHEVGMNLELDEFTVNLKADPTMEGTQYLRAKMALSIQVPEKQNCYLEEHEKKAMVPEELIPGGKVVGAAVPVDRTMLANEGGGPSCDQIFKNNMSKYVPTARDVINAALMKRTASSLSTLEGQESLKDEIKDQLSQIMAPEYKVLRVNFQDFIIQK
jgi:flagellar basal body-associated protein FliL